MGCYKVRFGDYCLPHYDSCKYFDYFEFKGKKYPIGAYVNLTESGERHILSGHGHGFIRGNFRLVDCFIDNEGVKRWKYIIGKSYNSNMYYFQTTNKTPDELISSVLCAEIDKDIYSLGELQVDFKEPNYFPKDCEVEGVAFGWVMLILVWIGAFIFKAGG